MNVQSQSRGSPPHRYWHVICLGKRQGHEESNMSHEIQTTLGDLISIVYQEFLSQYGDAELAATATAASVNDMLLTANEPSACEEAA